MESKTRLSTSCTKRRENTVNLVTSRNMNTRLTRPFVTRLHIVCSALLGSESPFCLFSAVRFRITILLTPTDNCAYFNRKNINNLSLQRYIKVSKTI